MALLREFKPALFFLGKFLLIYFVGNTAYGLYVESYGEKPDALTVSVSAHTGWSLNRMGYNCFIESHDDMPKVALKEGGDTVLNVYEGCNGLNVIIVFIAFVVAFGGPIRRLLLFLISGILIIHISNLLRIGLLYNLSLNGSPQFYYYHKYFFTAILYAVVFALWAAWVIWFYEKQSARATV